MCSCLPTYTGSPPGCRPECTVSSECPQNKACIAQKCSDPCPGTCGINSDCRVINHNPLCSCLPGYTGDPFTSCYRLLRKSSHLMVFSFHSTVKFLAPPPPREPIVVNPCLPSPCGPYSECRDIGGSPSCSCSANYIGSPPNCRPECTVHSDCGSNLACIAEKCADPCPGSCGIDANCNVINHIPTCTCPEGFTGDPFRICFPKPPTSKFHGLSDKYMLTTQF